MITLFVGDTDRSLSTAATKADANSTLINVIGSTLKDGTYHISLGDFNSYKPFLEYLEQADVIVYCPPLQWSDTKDNISMMRHHTEFLILCFRNKKTIYGLEKMLDPAADINVSTPEGRKTQNKQLWIAGCSVSHGYGVTNDQRYGQLISNKLNIPVSFLTTPGASNEWAVEQILLSDIKENDIVILGLTSFNRFYYYDTQIRHITPSEYDDATIKKLQKEIFFTNFIPYKNLSHINQVINFCNKIHCKLLIAGILVDSHDIYYTKNIDNYIQLSTLLDDGNNGVFFDYGTDNHHPGPKTHQWYAEQILKNYDFS